MLSPPMCWFVSQLKCYSENADISSLNWTAIVSILECGCLLYTTNNNVTKATLSTVRPCRFMLEKKYKASLKRASVFQVVRS